MSDLIKSPTSINTNNDALARVRPAKPQETPSHIITNPNKVAKTNQKEKFLNDDNRYLQKNKSNYESFLNNLRQAGSLSDILGKSFIFRLENILSTNLDSNFATEIEDLSNMLNMTEDELLIFIKNQFNTSVKFTGSFFDIIRVVYNSTTTRDLKYSILEFLKKFDSYSSSNHTNNNIISNLNTILTYLPKSYAQELERHMQNLFLDIKNGDTENNLQVLKEDIIPYLAKYIKQTNNFGDVRNYISVLTANVARLENANRNDLLLSFDYLMSFAEMKNAFISQNIDDIKLSLLNFNTNNENLSIIDKLLDLISRNNKTNINSQITQSTISTILLNESVYMPLMHTIIPACINGKMFFSEIWVDKDAKNEASSMNVQDCFKFFIKFDIEGLGFFEMILQYEDSNIFMNLYVPQNLKNTQKYIQENIKNIFKNNNLDLKNMQISESTNPKTLPEVFPKILERKTIINVNV